MTNNPSDATVSEAMLVAGHRAWADLLVDESVVDSDDGLTRLWIAMTSARKQPVGDEGLYHELLYGVSMKHPGETRHETALRYIRQAEERSGDEYAKALATSPTPDSKINRSE